MDASFRKNGLPYWTSEGGRMRFDREEKRERGKSSKKRGNNRSKKKQRSGKDIILREGVKTCDGKDPILREARRGKQGPNIARTKKRGRVRQKRRKKIEKEITTSEGKNALYQVNCRREKLVQEICGKQQGSASRFRLEFLIAYERSIPIKVFTTRRGLAEKGKRVQTVSPHKHPRREE